MARALRLVFGMACCLIGLTIAGPVWALPAVGAGADLRGDDQRARSAVIGLVGGGAAACGLRFVGLDDYFAGPTVEAVVKARKGGQRYTAAFWVSESLEVFPHNPIAGEIVRGCKGDPKAPGTLSAWKSLTYFDGSGASIGSNRRWKGAREIYLSNKSNKPRTKLADADGTNSSTAVWAGRCRPGKQRARFSRKFWLPGEAIVKGFARVGVFEEPFFSKPMKWARMSVNGRSLGKARFARVNEATFDVPAAFFKHGENTVTVVAQKKKTGRCNPLKGGRKTARLGIRFNLTASFGADLQVSDRELTSPLTTPEYSHEITVTNNGPSTIYSGRLSLTIRGPNWTESDGYTARIEGGPEGSSCSGPVTNDPAEDGVIVCSFKNLQKGQSGAFVLTTLARPTGKSYSFRWTGTVEGYGIDRNTGNESGQASQTWCADSNGDGLCG